MKQLWTVVCLALVTAPLAAEAQPAGRMYRIAYISMAPGPSPRSEALREGLRALGYVEGENSVLPRETQFAGHALRLQMHTLKVQTPSDLEQVIRAAQNERADALAVLTDPVTLFQRTELAALTLKHRLPAIYTDRLFAEAGGLMSYRANDRSYTERPQCSWTRSSRTPSPPTCPSSSRRSSSW